MFRIASILYSLAVRLRNCLYDHALLASRPSSLPTICVGNLAVGGTGKTPHSEYLLRHLPGRKAYVSRGYRRHSRGMVVATPHSTSRDLGDEAYQIHRKFPDVQVVVSADRHLAVDTLSRRGDIDIVILDDAFQHRNIRATRNILLTDYASDPRHDLPLPAGPMRDNFSSVRRADIVVVTKCPMTISPEDIDRKRRQLSIPQPVIFSFMRYGTPYRASDLTTVTLSGQPTLLFTGIEKPEPLADHLRTLTSDLRTLRFPDHHDFTDADIARIMAEAQGCLHVVTTEKDHSRLSASPAHMALLSDRLVIIPIEIDFFSPEDRNLIENIFSLIPDKPI